MKITNKQTIKNLTRAIVDHYSHVDHPPADKILVPNGSLSSINDEPNFFKATVRTEVNWTNDTIKSHKVNIKFALTPNGKLDFRTLSYL